MDSLSTTPSRQTNSELIARWNHGSPDAEPDTYVTTYNTLSDDVHADNLATLSNLSAL